MYTYLLITYILYIGTAAVDLSYRDEIIFYVAVHRSHLLHRIVVYYIKLCIINWDVYYAIMYRNSQKSYTRARGVLCTRILEKR